MTSTPRTLHRLTARRVATVAHPGWYADGGGLWLRVAPGGSKSWAFRFKVDGRERWHGLGSLRAISLSDARARAAECRKLRAFDVDPVEKRKAERAARKVDAANAITFRVAAERYVAAHRGAWRNDKHKAQWSATLETYANPEIGDMPVASIETGHVLRVIEPLWTIKGETASRLRQRIERVLAWATARGYRAGENPARWRGHLDQTLPARKRSGNVRHHAALRYADVPAFVARLRGQSGVAARALEFAILTAARTNEVIGARWDEIDLDAALWTVPAARMKAHREHRVPLAEPAVKILRRLYAAREGDFVFPGGRRAAALSNMAMLVTLRRMGREDITVHGFRSAFRDWCAEATAHPHEVAEMALAHAVGDKVEAAYRRGDLFEKRRALANDWAAFVEGTRR